MTERERRRRGEKAGERANKDNRGDEKTGEDKNRQNGDEGTGNETTNEEVRNWERKLMSRWEGR